MIQTVFHFCYHLLINSVSQWLCSEDTAGNNGKNVAKGKVKQQALFSSKKAVLLERGDFFPCQIYAGCCLPNLLENYFAVSSVHSFRTLRC